MKLIIVSEKKTGGNMQKHLKKSEMSWIVVKDIKKALDYFTKVLGLKLLNYHEEFGWAELSGSEPGGSFLGIAQVSDYDQDSKPGQNAVMTFTVDDIEKAIGDLKKNGAKFIGELCVVPDHVKLQTFEDLDGNRFQLAEELSEKKQ